MSSSTEWPAGGAVGEIAVAADKLEGIPSGLDRVMEAIPFTPFLSSSLGLDSKGDGVMQRDTRIVGTAFLFMPVAVEVSERIRYRRLADDCR